MRATSVCLFAAALTAGCLSFPSADGDARIDKTVVAFETVETGAYSGVSVGRTEVVRDRAGFARMFEQVSMGRLPEPPPKPIDFETEMVVAVFMGTRRSGGYMTEIVTIEERPDEIVVRYHETVPQTGMILSQAISAPYHIVKTKRSEKTVRFEAI